MADTDDIPEGPAGAPAEEPVIAQAPAEVPAEVAADAPAPVVRKKRKIGRKILAGLVVGAIVVAGGAIMRKKNAAPEEAAPAEAPPATEAMQSDGIAISGTLVWMEKGDTIELPLKTAWIRPHVSRGPDDKAMIDIEVSSVENDNSANNAVLMGENIRAVLEVRGYRPSPGEYPLSSIVRAWIDTQTNKVQTTVHPVDGLLRLSEVAGAAGDTFNPTLLSATFLGSLKERELKVRGDLRLERTVLAADTTAADMAAMSAMLPETAAVKPEPAAEKSAEQKPVVAAAPADTPVAPVDTAAVVVSSEKKAAPLEKKPSFVRTVNGREIHDFTRWNQY